MKKVFLIFVLVVGVVGTALAFGGHPFLKDPARMVVKALDFRLDLTDAQESAILNLLRPAIAELSQERKKQMDKPEELLKKVGDGTLSKDDVKTVMIKRRAFAEAHQDKIAGLVVDVYKVLTETQRKELAGIMQEHLDRLMK